MKKIVKRILKILGGLLAVLCVVAIAFIAMNFTLMKNLPNAQDAGVDAMYIANQTPLQKIQGNPTDKLELSQSNKVQFKVAHENWEQTGGKSLLVWHQGELIYETYAEGVLSTDRSQSFSMHKSILGLVAATMEADGLIDLDDPVSLYICLLYTSPSPRDGLLSRMPSSA